MKEKYRVHITYDENICLAFLNKVLDAVSKGYNDVNRDLGVKNNKEISELSPIIDNFKEGSLILELIVSFISGVASGIVANAIHDRLKKIKDKNVDIELNYKENADGTKEINIHIHK